MRPWTYFPGMLFALSLLSIEPALMAAPPTALAVAKIGDKLIPSHAKDKVIQIYSERSENGLAPDVWYVEYYDPTVAFKKTQLKFVRGKVVETTHPKHVLDTFSGTKQLNWRKLKIDSDKALSIALKDPLLKHLDLQAAQYWLQLSSVGPTWKLRFWMPQLSKPGKLNQIGDVYILSQTGEILREELHP